MKYHHDLIYNLSSNMSKAFLPSNWADWSSHSSSSSSSSIFSSSSIEPNNSNSSIDKQVIAVIRNTFGRARSSVSFIMGPGPQRNPRKEAFPDPYSRGITTTSNYLTAFTCCHLVEKLDDPTGLDWFRFCQLKLGFICTSSNATLLANCLVTSAKYHWVNLRCKNFLQYPFTVRPRADSI